MELFRSFRERLRAEDEAGILGCAAGRPHAYCWLWEAQTSHSDKPLLARGLFVLRSRFGSVKTWTRFPKSPLDPR